MNNYDRILIPFDKDSLAATVKPFAQVGTALTVAALVGRAVYGFWPIGACAIYASLAVCLLVGAGLRRAFGATRLPVFTGSMVVAGGILILAYLSDPAGAPSLLALFVSYVVMSSLSAAAWKLDRSETPPDTHTLCAAGGVIGLAVVTFPIPSNSPLFLVVWGVNALLVGVFFTLAVSTYLEYLAANPDLSPEMARQILRLRLPSRYMPWGPVWWPAVVPVILAVVVCIDAVAEPALDFGCREYVVGDGPKKGEQDFNPFFKPKTDPAQPSHPSGDAVREDPRKLFDTTPNLPMPEVFPKPQPVTLRLYPTEVLVARALADLGCLAGLVALFVNRRFGARQVFAVWLAPDTDPLPGVFQPPLTLATRRRLLVAVIASSVLNVRVQFGDQEEWVLKHFLTLLTAFRGADGEQWWGMLLSFLHHLLLTFLAGFTPVIVIGLVSMCYQPLHDRWLAAGLAEREANAKREDEALREGGGV